MQRRELLKLAALGAGAGVLRQSGIASIVADRPGNISVTVPIIDSHIHLFDPTRRGGVPWPERTDTPLYKPALPERYASIAQPLGVVGAIAIEASPLASDNDWLLQAVTDHPIVVGMVGDLIPSTPTYLLDLDRLHANPLFLGFRYGNLWNRNLLIDLEKPRFIDGLKALAQTKLVLECANPDPDLIRAIVHVSDRVPDLRIVIDHLPHAALPIDAHARSEYWSHLNTLAQNRNIFVKLSEIPVLLNGQLQTDVKYYQHSLDTIWSVFGEDNIFFGSDWPNSDHVASVANTLRIVQAYVSPKGAAVCEKFFWKNSLAAYRWKKRTLDQPPS